MTTGTTTEPVKVVATTQIGARTREVAGDEVELTGCCEGRTRTL